MKKLKKIKTLIISRKKWSRRTKEDCGAETMLLDLSGKMCCLGFALRECGVPKNDIFMAGDPAALKIKVPDFSERSISMDEIINSTLSDSAILINDNPLIPDEDKEKQLIEIFGESGIKLTLFHDRRH
jgi:hypothetical protein